MTSIRHPQHLVEAGVQAVEGLFYAVLLITSARLGDIYGPRNVFAALHEQEAAVA